MWDVNELNNCQAEYSPGKWGPVKPIPYSGYDVFRIRMLLTRISDAWKVLTGKAAAVRWYK